MGFRIHFGFLIAAVGYMTGIFLLSSSLGDPEPARTAIPPVTMAWLLHPPLFAGLAFCLLLSTCEGNWSRRVSWQKYALTGLIAAGFAGFVEVRQLVVPGQHATLADFLLNCMGITALLGLHRFAIGRDARAWNPSPKDVRKAGGGSKDATPAGSADGR